MKAINVQVNEDLYNQIKQHAQQNGKTLAQAVREALQQYLTQQEKQEQQQNEIQEQQQNEIQELKQRLETLEKTIQTLTITPQKTHEKRIIQHTNSTQTIAQQKPSQTNKPKTPTHRSYPQGKYETYIIKVMKTQTQQTWHWNTVAQEILKIDPSINILSVKDRMNRMSKQGLITKVGPGEYQLNNQQ